MATWALNPESSLATFILQQTIVLGAEELGCPLESEELADASRNTLGCRSGEEAVALCDELMTALLEDVGALAIGLREIRIAVA